MKFFVTGFVMLAVTLSHGAERYSILYRFHDGANDLSSQEALRPILHGDALYGCTRGSGGSDKGTIYRINKDGTGFTVLHKFAGFLDGYGPCSALVDDGDYLYGMTSHDDRDNFGMIFSLKPDGSDFKIIHRFQGWHFDGAKPFGSLTLDAGKLYGFTARGGSNDCGVFFSLNKDGSDYAFVHRFIGGRTDGATPYRTPIVDSNAFYGTTFAGGIRNKSVIFRLSKDGSDYKILHHFTGRANEAGNPSGRIISYRDMLYGMTFDGGAGDKGCIYSIRKDGTGFTILHSFAVTGYQGSHPHGALALHNDAFYGITRNGGCNDAGVLFCIKPDGKQFTILHRFANPSDHSIKDDGVDPYGSLTVAGDALYGMTRRGGKGGGIIFRYDLQKP
jgi:uncharacterized repeat protein (TIGR03803 family)